MNTAVCNSTSSDTSKGDLQRASSKGPSGGYYHGGTARLAGRPSTYLESARWCLLLVHDLLEYSTKTRSLQSDAGSVGLPDFGDNIDQMTFEQILEMDDDEEERDFSKSIVFGFFEQAEATFKKMDTSL